MNRLLRSNILLLEDFIKQIMDYNQAVGLGIAIIDGKGDTKYQQFFGYRDEEKQLPVDENTIFGIASITKSFTCMSIMQLAEKGLLCVQDPISKYIPEFTNKNQEEVTIWHLMNHCAGFAPLPRTVVEDVAKSLGLDESVEGDFVYSETIAVEGTKRVAQQMDEQTLENGGLLGRPGEYLSYCNDGYGILSEIVRRVGEENSYAEYVKNHILTPLNMERSGCDYIKPTLDDNSSMLYKKKQGVMCGHKNYHDNAFVLNGVGAMKSTLNDLKKYVATYMNEGKSLEGRKILSESSVAEMARPKQIYHGQTYYGYGLSIAHLEQLTMIGHGGSLPGVSSNIVWSKEADAGIIILCNTSDVSVSLIADAAMRVYTGKTPFAVRTQYMEEIWSKEMVAQASGVYNSGEGTIFEVLPDELGQVKAKINDKPADLMPINPYMAVMRNRFSDAIITFYKKEGTVFAMRYGGRIIPKQGTSKA